MLVCLLDLKQHCRVIKSIESDCLAGLGLLDCHSGSCRNVFGGIMVGTMKAHLWCMVAG